MAKLPKFEIPLSKSLSDSKFQKGRRCEIALTNLSGQPAPTNPTNKTVTAITLNHFR
jgi:hypothetical protein